MKIGPLRHRVRIDERVDVQNPTTLEMEPSWVPIAHGVACSIIPLSGREFVAGGGVQAQVNTRIEMRMRHLTSAMRIVNTHDPVGDDGRIYEIRAVLPDPTNARHINAACETGVTNG